LRSPCVTNPLSVMAVWSYIRDEGGPLVGGDQELPTNYRELLSLRAMVVSVAEKAGR